MNKHISKRDWICVNYIRELGENKNRVISENIPSIDSSYQNFVSSCNTYEKEKK